MKKFAYLPLLLSMGSANVLATDGTIHFTAVISATACSIETVAGTSSTAGVVDFGTVSSTTFMKAGDSTVSVPFTITLRDCAVTTAPEITFNGVAASSSSYKELYQTNVTGLGIRLEDADKTGTYYQSGVQTANTGFSKLGKDVTNATGNFNAYLVDYKGGQGKYTGQVDTDVTFVINYSDS